VAGHSKVRENSGVQNFRPSTTLTTICDNTWL
jgi:hypothetical protein